MTGTNSGAVDGRRHLFPLRVQYSHTDAGGVVYHAQYLVFADHARTEFLRLLGWPFDRMRRDHDAIWVVRRAALDLRRPAKLDDPVVVETTMKALRGASIDATQIVKRQSETLVSLQLQLALISPSGKPQRIPKGLVRDLAPYIDDTPTPTFAAS